MSFSTVSYSRLDAAKIHADSWLADTNPDQAAKKQLSLDIAPLAYTTFPLLFIEKMYPDLYQLTHAQYGERALKSKLLSQDQQTRLNTIITELSSQKDYHQHPIALIEEAAKIGAMATSCMKQTTANRDKATLFL